MKLNKFSDVPNKIPDVLNTPRHFSKNTVTSQKILIMLFFTCCVLLFVRFMLEGSYSSQQIVSEIKNVQEISRKITQLNDIIALASKCQLKKQELLTKIPLDSHLINIKGEQISSLKNMNVFLLKLKENMANISRNELKVVSFELNKIKEALHRFIFKHCNNQEIGLKENPAKSCADIPFHSPSGYYWMISNDSNLVSVYCNTYTKHWHTNTTGGWMRVANLDMKDLSHNCPEEFKKISRNDSPKRICGRTVSHKGCVSTTFPVYGIKYSQVCGRIIGYQVGSPDAFYPYISQGQTIDGYYINGISLTHGQSPRQHIWSFAGAVGENYHGGYESLCPCINNQKSVAKYVPPFVGNDYFCDTALTGYNFSVGEFYPYNPLWDGKGCGSTSACCEYNKPPWFCKQLDYSTSDDIELRICNEEDTSVDDTPFEVVQLYVN